jgi:hypothetical protein
MLRVSRNKPPPQEEDEELNDLITREYHFGGGLFTRKARSDAAGEADADGDAEAPPKTKKEIMMEIIAKSKSAKRERVKEKEADDEQLDALDLTFKALADVRAHTRRARFVRDTNSPPRGSAPPGGRSEAQPSHVHGPPEGCKAI